MRYVLALVFAGLLAPVAAAQEPVQEPAADATPALQILPADGLDLKDFLWVARPVVVFADSPADPRFGEQMELLAALPAELAERDVVVITDTDPAAQSAVRKALRPRGFMLALLGKDGAVYLRKPFPWDVRELTRSIDKLPLRQQEVEARRSPQ